jgi:hypothetical protein
MLTTAQEVYSQIGLMSPVERLRLANMLLDGLVSQKLSITSTNTVIETDVSQSTKRRQVGSAKGMITMAPDFDEPLEEFQEYME